MQTVVLMYECRRFLKFNTALRTDRKTASAANAAVIDEITALLFLCSAEGKGKPLDRLL